MHPKQALLKLQRVKNYLEYQREERKFKRKYGRTGVRPIQKAIALINKAIKEINKCYYIKSLYMGFSTIWAAEDYETTEVLIYMERGGELMVCGEFTNVPSV